MGANASNYPHSCSPRVGGNSQAQQTFIGTSSYSQQGYGCESKLYSLDHGHEKPQDKKKREPLALPLSKRSLLNAENLIDRLITPSRCENSSLGGMLEMSMH